MPSASHQRGSPAASPRSRAHMSHIISSMPFSAATFASRSPMGSPWRRTKVLSSKKNMPTTSTPWVPASSWGRIMRPSL
jgi:hypothetical protein